MSMIIWSPGVKLEDIEKQVILMALMHYKNNKSQTAMALGISVRTLDTRLEEYKVQEDEKAAAIEQRRVENENMLLRSRGFLVHTTETPEAPISQELESESFGIDFSELDSSDAIQPVSTPIKRRQR